MIGQKRSCISIIPEPKKIHLSDDEFRVSKEVQIEVAGKSKVEELNRVASFLQRRIGEKLNRKLTTTRKKRPIQYIRLTIASSAKLDKLGPEGYKLQIGKEGVTISSSAPQGVFYGVQTLLQIIEAKGSIVPCLEIEDWPDLKMRGLFISLIIQLPKFSHFLELVEKMSYYKLNTLVIQYEDKFPYQTDPLLPALRTLSESQIKTLLQHARQHYIEVIPLLHALNFQQYILRHNKYAELRHGEFTGRRVRGQACPQQRQTFDLFKSLYREILHLHGKVRYFHIGADEQCDLAGCLKCEKIVQEKGKAYLYFEYFQKVLKFVKEQGQIPLMWADMILGHQNEDRRGEVLQMARKYIPADTIVCDWDYASEDNASKKISPYGVPGFSHFDTLVKKGWPALAIPAIKCAQDGTDSINFDHCLRNISGFCRKAAQAGGLGVLNTLWPNTGSAQLEWISSRSTYWHEVIRVSWDQRRPPLEANWYGIVCGAEYSWSANKVNLKQFVSKFAREFWGIEDGDCMKAVHKAGLKIYEEDAAKRVKELKDALKTLKSLRKQVKRNHLSFEYTIMMGRILRHKAEKLVLFAKIEQFSRDNKSSSKKLLEELNALFADLKLLEKDIKALYGKTLYPEEVKEEIRLRYLSEEEYIQKYKRALKLL